MLKPDDRGHLHPLSQIIFDVSKTFESMGFMAAQGPEVETEFNNFDALNVPANHPARAMQDTFWLKPREKKYALAYSYDGGLFA